MKLTGLQGFLLTFTGIKVVLCLTKARFSWVALLQVAGTAGFGSSLQLGLAYVCSIHVHPGVQAKWESTMWGMFSWHMTRAQEGRQTNQVLFKPLTYTMSTNWPIQVT